MNSPITLDALKVLDAIERNQSFAAAAEELFRVPSAISYTINKLEEDLQITLFDRSKRKAQLTAVGKLIVEQGRHILKATDDLTHIAKQSADGWELELRIAVDSILRFQPIYQLIAQFQTLYPWINIKLTEEVFGGTWDALDSDRCDLLIGGIGVKRDSAVNSYDIGSIDFVFAVAKNHPLCRVQQPLSKEIIKQYPSVVVADSSRVLVARSAGLLDGQARITVTTIAQKIEAQILGIGVGYLPVHRIQQALQEEKLVSLTVANPDDRKHELCIAWRKDNKGKALSWFVKQIQALPNNVFLTQ